MATKALIAKARAKSKFKVRKHNRCNRCGRPRAFLRVEANSFINEVFGLSTEPQILYGRRNILATPGGAGLAMTK